MSTLFKDKLASFADTEATESRLSIPRFTEQRKSFFFTPSLPYGTDCTVFTLWLMRHIESKQIID